MTIRIKSIEVLHSLMVHPIDQKLIEVINWTIRKNNGGTITEGFRIQKHKNDLHGLIPVRAIDLRSWCYGNPEEVAKEINAMWEYDYNRPNMNVCVYHDVGQGKHFHIQVHFHTRKRI